MGRLLGINDLSELEFDSILDRARDHASGQVAMPQHGSATVVGSVFLETSLRTRIGFAAAAARLGWSWLDVIERRSSEVSMPESLADTLRVVADYTDLLVVRSPQTAEVFAAALPREMPLVNAGDGGSRAEHPTQTLIDVFAIEELVGPVDGLHVAICGDLRMRSVRSLLTALARRLPSALTLVSRTPSPEDPVKLPAGFEVRTLDSLATLGHVDVLYVAGVPHGALDEEGRSALRVDRRVLDRLPASTAVLSPMPIIDEVASTVRDDPRMRYLDQSALGLFVRMAVLEHVHGS